MILVDSHFFSLIAHIPLLIILALTACQPTIISTNQAAMTTTPTSQLFSPPTKTSFESRDIVATIPLNWKPTLIAEGNGILWVVGRENHIVVRLDPQTNQLVYPPTTLPEPIYDIIVGEGGVWVTGDTMVTRLDPTTGNVAATIDANGFGDGEPFRLAIGDGSIWLINLIQATWGSHVHRIDPHSNRIDGEPAVVGIEAVGIAFGAGSIWTANHDDGTVSRVDPQSNKVSATIKLSFEPHYIYFNPDDRLIWVADYHHDSISRIDPNTNQLVGKSLQVPFAPEWMTSGDGKVWVLPSPYAENNVLQNFEGLAEFDTTNKDQLKVVSVVGRPMDAVVSVGSLWVSTQDPSQILRLALE